MGGDAEPGRGRAARGAASSPASSPTPTATASPSTGPLRHVTIAAVGDTMLGRTPVLPPDPATYLDPVRSALRAAIVFGNLEGTLTDATDSEVPQAVALALAVPVSEAVAHAVALARRSSASRSATRRRTRSTSDGPGSPC